jgi:DNA-binding IclR family transcriptional regulator
LGDEARRVLFALLAQLDYENFIAVNQAELGRQLKIKPSNMSRAVARLVQEGVLLAGPRLQAKGTYTLNPHYGWKGSAKGHQEALQARMKARGMSVVDGGAGAPGEDLDDRTRDLFDSAP